MSNRTGHRPRNNSTQGTRYTRRELRRLGERSLRQLQRERPERLPLFELFPAERSAATARYNATQRNRAPGSFSRPGPYP